MSQLYKKYVVKEMPVNPAPLFPAPKFWLEWGRNGKKKVAIPATTFPAHKKRWQMALGRPYLLKGGFKTTIQKVDWWREFNWLWATIPPEETTIKNLSSAGNLSWRLPYPQIKRIHFSFVLSVTLWRSKKWMKDVLYALQFLLVGHKKCLVLCVRDWCIVFVFLVIKGTK